MARTVPLVQVTMAGAGGALCAAGALGTGHNRIVRSREPLARKAPAGLKHRAEMMSVWPRRTIGGSSEAVRHTRTECSGVDAAAKVPSLLRAAYAAGPAACPRSQSTREPAR